MDSENSVYDSRGNCNAIIETATSTLIVGCACSIIPDSVTGIGECAFYNCSSLQSIDIPNSVTSIGWGAFWSCTAMTKFVVDAQIPPKCDDYAFARVNKQACTLYVTTEQIDAYKDAYPWGDFFNVESIVAGVESQFVDDATELERYNANGIRLAAPQKGINIIRMSDGSTRKVIVR